MSNRRSSKEGPLNSISKFDFISTFLSTFDHSCLRVLGHYHFVETNNVFMKTRPCLWTKQDSDEARFFFSFPKSQVAPKRALAH